MMLRDYVLALFIIVVAAVMGFAQDAGELSRSDLVGTWRTGGMSTMADRNTVTGATTPSNGNTMKFEFKADGRFAFTGYLQSTMYGCTTVLFNDKQGKFALSGSRLILSLSKNFWRNTYSCSPASNKERHYTLDPEVYDLRTKVDEYNKLFICLTSDKGETCYRREAE